jgi:PAS domain S-box-containing protein
MYVATAKFSDGPATVGFFLDITERKKAEQTLMMSEARLRAIYRGTNIGLALSDLNGKLIEINPAMQRMFGYNTEESLGKSAIGITHPDDAGADSVLFQQLLNGDIKDYRIEKRYIHKNGNIVWGRSNVSLVRDSYDKPLYAISLIEDISEQKRADAEKQRLREKAEMSSRLASVGEMAAGIAHEINNPLTAVIGFSEMLMERGDLPDDIRQDLAIINDGSHRVVDIVKRLLTFARQTKPQRVPTDINALIDNTIALRSYVLRTASIEVNTDYDPDLPALVVDPGQLQQVFLNLIVNAEHAMKNSSGKLTISSGVIKQRVRIIFRDSGQGIPPEVMPFIFNPFFTTKHEGEGTGLGLSVSRSIIIEHGGDLYAESQPGQGAVFTIELPLDDKTTAAQTPEAKPEAIVEQVKPAHILVVDDEPAIRELLGKILEKLGHSVDFAASSQEALDKISAQVYRLLILDIRLPGMDGMELYKRILAKAPEMKGETIFITGNVRSPDILEFFEQSRVPFFTKPFDIAALKVKVQSML